LYYTEQKPSGKERAVLAGVQLNENEADFQEIWEELGLLAESAGALVVGELVQKREHYDPAYLLGSGKLEELDSICYEKDADVIIFANDIKPIQERNLVLRLQRRVVDRQALILDIFAQRARTKEGKIQVELAQLNYLLPRLVGFGVMLSRLGGGIGTRGPGETKLETDRRHIRRRITTLKKELEKIRKHRELLRRSRQDRGFTLAALVGYTNAGKSTLLNSLTKAGVLVQDKLFATLDPTTKRLPLANGKEILLTDTVGFIKNLPHTLVAAFHATLEEVQEADLLLHVIDLSHPKVEEQIEEVNEVLAELACDNKPTLMVFNKIDKSFDVNIIKKLKSEYPDAIFISALKKEGLKELLAALDGVRERSVFYGKT
jgi:GTP-binding protein HflX